MIKNHALIIGVIIFMMSCSNISNKDHVRYINNVSGGINMDSMKYKIIITNYCYGRIQHITTVTQDSLQIKRDLMTGKRSSESRALTPKETEMMREFLIKFPLVGLNKQYVTETVEDGTVIDFSITINDQHKDIYVANKYQKDLGNLVEVIVKLLKEDYIGYNQSSVPFKE